MVSIKRKTTNPLLISSIQKKCLMSPFQEDISINHTYIFRAMRIYVYVRTFLLSFPSQYYRIHVIMWPSYIGTE